MFQGVYDRVIAKMSSAGRVARFLGSTSPPSRCPLELLMGELTTDELVALAEIVDASGGARGGVVQVTSFAPHPPVKRLLAQFIGLERPIDDYEGTWSRRQIESRIRAADGEAFAALLAAMTAECTRRG